MPTEEPSRREQDARKIIDVYARGLTELAKACGLNFLLVISPADDSHAGSIACNAGFSTARELIQGALDGIDAAEKIVQDQKQGMPEAG